MQGEIFEVSLDELVKGEKKPRETVNAVSAQEPAAKENGVLPRKITGTF